MIYHILNRPLCEGLAHYGGNLCAPSQAVDSAFGLSPGFYWQTLENQDPSCQRVETMCTQQLHTEVSLPP